MNHPNIELENVSKCYNASNNILELLPFKTGSRNSKSKKAVDEVSLTISTGERIGIIGRNGAGKSTLLHLIAGLSLPSSGIIKIKGKVTSVMTMGIGIREELSGRENIYIDGELQGKSRKEIDKVIGEIIDFADIGKFIDYPVRTYSTGMKSRLAFSMIANIDPEILLIDEALSAGDAKFSTKATKRIREICSKGKIVLVVAHSMQSIVSICNRCLWMDKGRIVMDGSPEKVTQAYLDAVRSEDEHRLEKKFKQSILNNSRQEGWRINKLQIYNANKSCSTFMLNTGKAAEFYVNAIVRNSETTIINIKITRLDNLLCFDESFQAIDYMVGENTMNLNIKMSPFILNESVYKLSATIWFQNMIQAERSLVFEVVNDTPLSGGKPALICPFDFAVSQDSK
ncbi:MAG: ABC transporter ATP-binding protein [Gammaproteobacteria bacterium]